MIDRSIDPSINQSINLSVSLFQADIAHTKRRKNKILNYN